MQKGENLPVGFYVNSYSYTMYSWNFVKLILVGYKNAFDMKFVYISTNINCLENIIKNNYCRTESIIEDESDHLSEDN